MTTSSADPDRLEAYPGQLTAADDELTTLALDVDEASDAFVAGAGSYVGSFDASWAGDLVRGLRDESHHLSGWVASVGAAFREAGALGIPLDQLDNFISQRVGEPTIWEAEQAAAGQQAAAELRARLQAIGIDPDHIEPSQLWMLDPSDDRFREIYELMAGIGGRMWNEDFAVGFYDQMDTAGIHAVLGVIDTFAARYVGRGLVHGDMAWMGSVQDRLLDPFVNGWANASSSVDLTEERQGLLATEDAVDQRHLALLMSGNASMYEPRWLADAAERILVTGAEHNRWQFPAHYGAGSGIDDYPGFSDSNWLYDDPALGFPELVAARALDGNTEAAWSYASRGDAHLEALVRPVQLPYGVSGRDYEVWEKLQIDMETHAGGALEEAFLAAPFETVPDPNDPSRQVPLVDPAASAQAYNDLIEVVGDGDVPDIIKRSVARTLLPHLHEIGAAANTQYHTPAIETDVPFERGDVVDFFKELGWDEQAAAIVGEQLGQWGAAVATDFVGTHPHASPGDIEGVFDPVALVTGAVYQGFNETENAMSDANNLLAFGIQQGSGAFSGLGMSGAIIGFVAGGPPGAAAGAALAGGTVIVNQAAALGANALRTRDADLDVDGNDIQRMMIASLREQLVLRLEDAGLIPDGTAPEDYSSVLADYYRNNDPIDELNQDSYIEAWNRDAGEPW